MNVTRERPFRGPHIYESLGYTYKSSENGDFNWFQGYETIEHNGHVIYECYYHGGSIK